MPRRVSSQGGTPRRSRELTRSRIVGAALELLDRDGVAAVTMRRVAEALGVTPMALYNHVSGKADLLRAIAAHVLDGAVFDPGDLAWRARIEFCFREFRALCLRHPGLATLLETADAAPASAFAPMDVTLRAFRKAGLDDLTALRAYFTLVSFTLGQAAYETRGPVPGLEPSAKNRRGTLAGRGYGAVERIEVPDDWDFDAAFECGLGLILDGVEAAAGNTSAIRG